MNALRRFEPYAYALLRIVAGLLFLFHGLQKFGLLGGQMVPLVSLAGAAAVIETVGGLLIMIGFADGAGGVHLQRRDGLRLLHGAPAERPPGRSSERRRARGAVRVHLSLHRDARLRAAERERRQVSAADAARFRPGGGRVAARAAAGSAQSTARSHHGRAGGRADSRQRRRGRGARRPSTASKRAARRRSVTGVVTTVMATRRVLARRRRARTQPVVTQEPVFYNANDEPGNRASDAIYLAKKAYIEQHGLVVFRFADHWNSRQPDPRVAALARALSWEGPGTNGVFTIRETTPFQPRCAPSRAARDSRRIAHARCPGTCGSARRCSCPGTTDVPTMMAG